MGTDAYNAKRDALVKEPRTIAIINLDFCDRTYGEGDCDAHLGVSFFDIFSFEPTPTGVAFSSDGTKMFVVGSTNAEVFQFNLSKPWNVFSAVDSGTSLDVSTEAPTPTDLAFSSDGLTMFILDKTNAKIFQYTLLSPWVLAGGAYAGKFRGVGTEDANPAGLAMSQDGTKIYMLGDGSNTVYQYTLPTPDDLVGSVYSGKSISIAAKEATGRGLDFSPDGTKMYVVGTQRDTVFQYTLSTPDDVSTALFASKEKLVSSEDALTEGLAMRPDGTKMYIVGNTNQTIYQYKLTTARNVSTAEYISTPITGTEKCTNTRKSCQDPANYLTTVGRDYTFSMHNQPNPFPGTIVRPYIAREIGYDSTEIDPLGEIKGFRNASGTIELYDEPDNDVGIDPYPEDRDPVFDATFFQSLLARNFYNERPIEIGRGFEGLPVSDYVFSKYIITAITGPGVDNKYKVLYKDMLKKADSVKVPAASSGKLTAGIDDAVTSFTLDDSTGYPSPATTFWVAIDNENIKCTANNTGTGVVTVDPAGRGVKDSTAATHNSDAKVQLCYVKESVGVWDIMNDILQNEIGIAAADIDVAGNAAEDATWLISYVFSTFIRKPVSSATLLTELSQHSTSFLFWSEDEKKIKLVAMKIPATDVADLNDTEHLMNVVVDRNDKARVSRSVVYFNKNALGDLKKSDGYEKITIDADLDREGADQYGSIAPRYFFSRWITLSGNATRLGNLTMRRFSDPPIILNYEVELKDGDTMVGEFVKITTVKVKGANRATLQGVFYQVLKKQRKGPARVAYKVMDARFTRRYGRIAPSGTPDFGAASDDVKQKYVFVGDSNNLVGVGEDGYYIF